LQIDELDLSASGSVEKTFLDFIEECVHTIQKFNTKVCKNISVKNVGKFQLAFDTLSLYLKRLVQSKT